MRKGLVSVVLAGGLMMGWGLALKALSPGETPAALPVKLKEEATSRQQWTGITVSRSGRMFVNFPRWSDQVPVSVAEILPGGKVKPYPDAEWNRWESSLPLDRHFVAVQSVYVDAQDFLWVVDTANAKFQGIVEGGPKLVKIDLKRDKVVKVITLDAAVTPKACYLNDIVVEGNTGYLTESGTGALLVVDLTSGKARRLLSHHPSTQAEDITLQVGGKALPLKVHSDGIALDRQGRYLYYKALTGRKLYRIKLDALKNEGLSEEQLGKQVEYVGDAGPTDGLLYADGHVYLTSVEQNAIQRISPKGHLQMVAQSDQLEWPDGFAIHGDTIYFTTSKVGFETTSSPHKIFSFKRPR